MLTQLQSAARKGLRISWNGFRYIPYGAAALLIVSMLFKLAYLDRHLNVGGMNHWKWEVNLGAMMLATFWTAFLGPRARIASIVVLDLLLSAVIFSDLVYFRYFKDFISVPVLMQAGQVSSLQDSISSLIIYKDAIYFADLPFAILIAVWVFRNSSPKRGYRPPGTRRFQLSIRLLTGILAFAIGYQLIAIPVEQQKNGWAAGLFEGNWWNVPIYNVTGLFGFHGYDAYRYAKENWLGGGVTEEQIQQAKDWINERRQLQKQAESDPLFGAYKGKNVLVVQAEAFQAFLINQKIGGQEITPNLNKLIGRSVYFPNFYHQTANGRTSDADFATSCSFQPVSSGSVFIRFASHEFDCLPQVLKAEGYGATVHHAYDGSFWNRNNMYHNMDYDKFYNIKDFKIDEPLGWSLGDKSFFRQTVQQIADRDKYPFYAMAITLSSHHPYAIGKHDLDVGNLNGTLLGTYIQAAHYVDEAVAVLVDELNKAGLWDDTILMFYGDHDNSINNWDDYAKLFGRPVTELEKSTILKKVPFFIHLPNDEHAGVNEKAVGQIDTEPTILHLLGIQAENYAMMGVSMMSSAPKNVVFRNGGFTDGNVFFVPGSEGILGRGTCYSMKDGSVQDASVCLPGAQQARTELQISDRIVDHDLVPRMKEETAQK
ncbi:sulfatase-like hydrolase/transferase [Cohnella sp. CFH 77786]|uniref:LTA synthase family protein n=1 Tax=Cohnella sp. CFH 77786 TaxID=2662265 RepID=UPI001C60EF3A|nr:LTA synthase family protein [Cohnella sp. CFH 77786]MBW5445026.1 sulfatase-like hydrolase/transferase [Cohnella sp. CFH 77786]